MKIKPNPLIVDENDPFKNDGLNRKESAEILTQFVKNLSEPYVIGLDSPWGAGKTTFLQMWQACLKNDGVHSLYFNAWETDFSDDPLIALIKEMELNFSNLSLDSKQKTTAKKYLQKAKKASYSLLKRGLPAAIKLATYGLIDASSLTESVVADTFEKMAKEQFASYENSKKSLQSFKTNLKIFSQSIITKENAPLVFIIDELDRCRPDYAIQLLEKIKHLFSTEGIVFVLGIHKDQLSHSIRTLYGNEFDAKGYLNRFIDLDYFLPKPDKNVFIRFTFDRHQLEEYFSARKGYYELQYDKDALCNFFTFLFDIFNFSLREIEQLISQLVIVMKIGKSNEFLIPPLLCFLLVLRKKRPELYIKLQDSKITTYELIDGLNFRDLLKNEQFRYIRAYLELSMNRNPGNRKEIFKRYNSIAEVDSEPNEQEDAIEMLTILNKIDTTYRPVGNMIDFLVKKIEISQRFK